MAKEFITKDNLNTLFSKTASTRADTLQGGGILIQSGLGNLNTGSMTATVSYPKTFPTKCCVVLKHLLITIMVIGLKEMF